VGRWFVHHPSLLASLFEGKVDTPVWGSAAVYGSRSTAAGTGGASHIKEGRGRRLVLIRAGVLVPHQPSLCNGWWLVLMGASKGFEGGCRGIQEPQQTRIQLRSTAKAAYHSVHTVPLSSLQTENRRVSRL
jgi:hypothetical protein